MCNINIVINLRKADTRAASNYMNMASWNSWKTNNEGEGSIGLSARGLETARRLGKIKYVDSFWFLATHQRQATSGKNDREGNIHPHETEHLLLMHNGVFYGLGSPTRSDTKEFLDSLESEYVSNNKDIVAAIKAVTKKHRGTFSILVYEKSTGKILYFKENFTVMYALRNNNWLVMSTKWDNMEYAKFFFDLPSGIMEVKSHRIIDLMDYRVVGKFKEPCFRKYANDEFSTAESSGAIVPINKDEAGRKAVQMIFEGGGAANVVPPKADEPNSLDTKVTGVPEPRLLQNKHDGDADLAEEQIYDNLYGRGRNFYGWRNNKQKRMWRDYYE